MSDNQYMQYQDQSMPKRMKRKRKFDEFTSGSNINFAAMLNSAETFRVPFHSLFYVRANEQSSNQMQNDSDDGGPNRSRITFDAFQLMMQARNKHSNMNNDIDEDEEM